MCFFDPIPIDWSTDILYYFFNSISFGTHTTGVFGKTIIPTTDVCGKTCASTTGLTDLNGAPTIGLTCVTGATGGTATGACVVVTVGT